MRPAPACGHTQYDHGHCGQPNCDNDYFACPRCCPATRFGTNPYADTDHPFWHEYGTYGPPEYKPK
jgi:hypothetical protein